VKIEIPNAEYVNSFDSMKKLAIREMDRMKALGRLDENFIFESLDIDCFDKTTLNVKLTKPIKFITLGITI